MTGLHLAAGVVVAAVLYVAGLVVFAAGRRAGMREIAESVGGRVPALRKKPEPKTYPFPGRRTFPPPPSPPQWSVPAHNTEPKNDR